MRIIFGFLGCLLLLNGEAQLFQYQKMVCDSLNYDSAFDVDKFYDEGVIAVSQNNFPNNNSDSAKALVTRLDKNGNIIFSKMYAVNSTRTNPMFISATSDSSIILGGFNDASAQGRADDAFILKLDSLGNVIWSRHFGGDTNAALYNFYEYENTYFFVGDVNIPSTMDTKAFILKLDEQGNYMAEVLLQYGSENNTIHDIQVKNDSVYVCGSALSLSNNQFILKTDLNLNIQTQVIIDTIMSGRSTVSVLNNGDFLFTCNDFGAVDPVLMFRFTSGGQLIWAKRLLLPWPDVGITASNKRWSNGNLLFSCIRSIVPSQYYTMLFEMDTDGNYLWSLESVDDSLSLIDKSIEEFGPIQLLMATTQNAIENTVITKMNILNSSCFLPSDTIISVPVAVNLLSGFTATTGLNFFAGNIQASSFGYKEVTICYEEPVMDTLVLETIPNIFTPNSDGVNDQLVLDYPGYEFSITIFNRWGEIVSEYQGDHYIWEGKTTDGRHCSEGVYYYTFLMNHFSTRAVSGFIHLIR